MQRLQKHQVQAFKNSLEPIRQSVQRKLDFLINYGPVYNFPKVLMKKNIARYRKVLKAIHVLQNHDDYK